MIWFVTKPHSMRHGIAVVEVWRDKEGDPRARQGEFVATIYPTADGIRIVSAYDGLVHADIETADHSRLSRGRAAHTRLRVVNIDIREERLT